MQGMARSLSLTAALLMGVIVCLLVGAAPSQTSHPASKPTQLITPASGAPPLPPITFEDPDGQALILEDLSARVAIQGMLSLTELELRFRNPQSRRIEGRFTCTLPTGAAISRFAKEVNGQLMEGEVVERLRANQIYEQFLHQMRDPALLEQDQGNRFSARIFPIEGNTTVRLVLSYTMLLPLRDGARTYTLPLRGLPKVGNLAFRAVVSALPGEESTVKSSLTGPGGASRSTAEVVSFEERDKAPDHDVVLSWRPTADAARNRVIRAGDFYVAALRPDVRAAQSSTPTSWLFYIDTSASSAEGAAHRVRALERLLASLPASDRVEIVAFDQDIVPLGNGSAAEMSRRIAALLDTRLFLGGTDLAVLLRAAGRAAADDSSRAIVIASDLVATLGTTDPKALNDAIATIPTNATVHALILGSREEAAVAKALTARRGRIVRVPFTDALDVRASEASVELRRPLGGSVDVGDAAAEWIYPTHFDDVAPGDEILVMGKVRSGATGASPVVLGNRAGEAPAAPLVLPANTFSPLLEREAWRAYLEYLAEREASEPADAVRRALATEQVRISIEQRVVIPRTTMLVLESEWDYQRFGLDRRALAAILTVDAGGIARVDRKRQHLVTTPNVLPMPEPRPRLVTTPGEAAKTTDDAVDFVAAAPEAAPAPARESMTVQQNAPVVGGVVGGVAGGVVGGVAGGAMRVPASAPPPRPSPVPPPEPSPVSPPPPPAIREERKADSSWTQPGKPSRADVERFRAKLRGEPRDRESYNQLGEALALLGEWSELRQLTLQWQPFDPENPQVYELLGMAAEQLGRETEAARAYASLIEVAPAKPELLQRAGLLLVRTGKAKIAETPLRRALELRPDRANGYRHLALMLWREGRVEEAARVLESATKQQFPGWYGNVQRVIREELGYVYRAWLAKEPARRSDIERRARDFDVELSRRDALRVTLAWETDANDVDLHVVDPSGEECFYGHKQNASGLALYEDITQGLGPEVIRTGDAKRGTYHVGVRYFSAGPMGVSRGIVVVMRGDDVEIHPFRLVQGGRDIRYLAAVNVK